MPHPFPCGAYDSLGNETESARTRGRAVSERDPIEETPPGAQVVLPIAQEHLIVNLNSIDAVDSRAMSLMAFNLAAIGSYVGAVVALGWSAECVAAPAAFFVAAMIVGMWGLHRRKVP